MSLTPGQEGDLRRIAQWLASDVDNDEAQGAASDIFAIIDGVELSPDSENLVLEVCLDGVIQGREFDPEEECIDAVGQALILKQRNPGSVVTVLVSGSVFAIVESRSLADLLDGPAAA